MEDFWQIQNELIDVIFWVAFAAIFSTVIEIRQLQVFYFNRYRFPEKQTPKNSTNDNGSDNGNDALLSQRQTSINEAKYAW